MKRTLYLAALLLLCGQLMAQETVTLSFTGKTNDNRYVPLDSVSINNLNANWLEMLYAPDTTLLLTVGVGINDFAQQAVLSQNYPNPYDAMTDVYLNLPKSGSVQMRLLDLNGRLIALYDGELQLGGYRFKVQTQMPQVYILSVTTPAGTRSVKMVNVGEGSENSITLENAEPDMLNVKGVLDNSDKAFALGDRLVFIGYKGEVESAPIVQKQYGDEIIPLIFDVNDLYKMPTVETDAIGEITDSSAVGGGNVLFDGGLPVTVRGVCWSLNENPTLQDSTTIDGNGTGKYMSFLSHLWEDTVYHVRAYATNDLGTAYGEDIQFRTAEDISKYLPVVQTAEVTNVAFTTATSGGNVTDDGGFKVMAYGVCWDTLATPTIEDWHTTDGNGTGSFVSNVSDLQPGTVYYLRAYATNKYGTSYGQELVFSTLDDTGNRCAKVADREGNVYEVVLLGTQCWMAENLRSLKFNDGTPIPTDTLTSRTEPYVYFPNDDKANMAEYGCLYNWVAILGGDTTAKDHLQGICPQGWHVPDGEEWNELLTYVKSNTMNHCKGVEDNIAKALASTKGWTSSNNNCAVGNDPMANNATGFGAMPAGDHSKTALDFGTHAMFWTSSMHEEDDTKAFYIDIAASYANITSFYMKKNYGLSVRCVKNRE